MTRTEPKPAKCDKCKSEYVTWFKSKRTGKYYLCEVFIDAEGDRVSSSRDFHSKYCGIDGAHEAEQARLTGTEEKTNESTTTDYALAKARDISRASIAEKVITIAELVKADRVISIQVMGALLADGHKLEADMLAGLLEERR